MDDVQHVLIEETHSDKRKYLTKRYISPNEYFRLITLLAQRIDRKKYRFVYGVPRGGLPIAVGLSNLLNIGFIKDFLSINSETLIVDDIVDNGTTMVSYLEGCDADFASLFVREGLQKELHPKYWIQSTDQWVVFPYEKRAIIYP